jgi:acetyl esterase
MSLHPQAEAYLKLLPTDLTTPFFELTPELIAEMRAMDAFAEQRGPIVPLPLVRDDVAAGVPVRIYRPQDGDHPLPAIVYFHGGGWVFGDVDRNDALGRDLAVRSEAVVISVDYRLAPDHPFPAAADDAWSVVKDVFARPEAYQADPEKIAVYGDSAGGNVASVAAWQARDAGLRLAHQVLV